MIRLSQDGISKVLIPELNINTLIALSIVLDAYELANSAIAL